MINIQNIYYMLAYAFQTLNKGCYANIETEKFDNVCDLFAAILAKGIGDQIKKGLIKDYILQTESISSLRGKIDISSSLKKEIMFRNRLVCVYDDFSENNYMNQILKTTSVLLINSDDVSIQRKNELKKVMLFFDNVKIIDARNIRWSSLRFHRNNATYKMLINICNFVIKGMLLTQQEGKNKLNHYMDDQRMHSLYEKFILEFYRKHYPQLRAHAAHIDWNVDDGIIEFLPLMKTDITLEYHEKTLIIDAKYYGQTMQKNIYSNSKTIHSNNIYQIFTYVKNRDVLHSGDVRGVLLYAKTDEEITPDNEYIMDGNKISVKTLDLNGDFSLIKAQLDSLVVDLVS